MPGIGFSPDKMLQARIFSYSDAHRYRVGVNYAALPVNQPHTEVNNYHRDGNMRFDDNSGRSGQLRAEQLRRSVAESEIPGTVAEDLR